MSKSGRVFTASLKPAWSYDEMVGLCDSMVGSASVFCITHDKDVDDKTGELVEAHTHIYIEYETPRLVSTVANLFNVSDNFIEVVKSKKAMLRYLTHKDDSSKYQYLDDEVITNSDIPYGQVLLGNSLSDREIAQYISTGRGYELLGIVSASKLRTIQSFLAFEQNGKMYKEMKRMADDMQSMKHLIDDVYEIATGFKNGLKSSISELKEGFNVIAQSIDRARHMSDLKQSHKVSRR